jgi:hypothetical protein
VLHVFPGSSTLKVRPIRQWGPKAEPGIGRVPGGADYHSGKK